MYPGTIVKNNGDNTFDIDFDHLDETINIKDGKDDNILYSADLIESIRKQQREQEKKDRIQYNTMEEEGIFFAGKKQKKSCKNTRKRAGKKIL